MTKISAEDIAKATEVKTIDSEATAQKASQVTTQAKSLQAQASASADAALQDAKAAKDKAMKELGKIPQKIEDTEDSIIDALKAFLGADPSVKKIEIKTPDGTTYKKPDFDPDKALNSLKKTIDPMLDISKPLQSVGGSIPLLGDLIGLLTSLATDTAGETEISEEELYKLMPSQPEIPPAISEKANKIVKLTGQAIMYMPIFLIDVIVNMIKAIYDMFDQIAGVIGVPPAIFPLNLIGDLISLVPKVKQLILTTPPTVEDIIEQKLKKKFHYAAALSIPKPNLSSVKNTVSSVSSTSITSKQTEVKPIEQSNPPPVSSNIQETPSVPQIEPKAPIAPETKPEQRYYSLIFLLNEGFSTSTGKSKKTDEVISLFKELRTKINGDIGEVNVVFETTDDYYKFKTKIPNDGKYNSIDTVGEYYNKIIKELKNKDIYDIEKYREKFSLIDNCFESYLVNVKSKFLGIF